jgi:heavy metal sensor kinase
MRLPIRLRLTAWYTGILALILVLLGGFLLVRLHTDLVNGVDDSLGVVVAELQLDLRTGVALSLPDDDGLRPTTDRLAAQVLAPDGSVANALGAAEASRPLLPADLRVDAAAHRVRADIDLGPGTGKSRVLAEPVPGRPGRVVAAAMSLEGVDRSVDRLRLLLLVAGPVVLVLAALGGTLVAGKALRPVAAMTTKAAVIGRGRLHERVVVPPARDELARLAVTLNGMLERIENQVAEQRRLVGDASHELRTPLAVMRAELDVGRRGAELPAAARELLASIDEEVEVMTRLVDNLLILARGDEGRLDLGRAPLRLDELAADRVDRMRSVAEAKGVRLTLRGEPAEVVGDRRRLGEVVTNLLDNAVKYTPAGGQVEVGVTAHPGLVRLTVDDTGPGIPADDLSRVFDRFYRVDSARSRTEGGAGLGLAICRELVTAHGGRITAARRPAGGSSLIVELPARLAASGPAETETVDDDRVPAHGG